MLRQFILFLVAISLLLAGGQSLAAAQADGGTSTALSTGFDLTWNTIDGGGGVSAGGGFEVSGSIGQAETGMLYGNAFALHGGFWVSSVSYRLYLPLIRQ